MTLALAPAPPGTATLHAKGSIDAARAALGASPMARLARSAAGRWVATDLVDRAVSLSVLEPDGRTVRRVDVTRWAGSGPVRLERSLDVHPSAERALVVVSDEVGPLVKEVALDTEHASTVALVWKAAAAAYVRDDLIAVLGPEGIRTFRRGERRWVLAGFVRRGATC
jgi:hypothetical protein